MPVNRAVIALAGLSQPSLLKQADLENPIEATGPKQRSAISWIGSDGNVQATAALKPHSTPTAAEAA